MSIRNVTLAAGVCLAASIAAFGQQGAGFLFQLPGQNSSANTPIYGFPYSANPLNPSINTLGPTGTYQIVAKPDSSGYYVLGTTLQVANQNFSAFTTINGISGTPTAVAVSPDAQYAVVGAGSVYVLGTVSGAILFNTTTNGTIVGIAISRDSKFAYVLSNGPGASYVNQINLVTKSNVGTPLQLGGNATSISFSPLNLLYVTATNRIYEIDPLLLQVTTSGTMTPNGTAGPLRYTPDGTTAYCVNQSSNVTGPAIFQITLATHFVNFWPTANPFPPTPIDDVIVAGNGRVFAVSNSTTTLFDVVTSPLGLTASALSSIINVQGVQAAAVSSELPSALYLYLLVASGGTENLYRINLSTNQISAQASSPSIGPLQFVGVPPQTGAGSFITFNSNLTVGQGITSPPLSARVLDLTGRPVFNLPVSFTTPSSNGVVINTPSPTTNADGWVQTTITAPAAQGTYTITLTAGTANTTFTITVPGVGGTGGPGPNGVTQVTIVTGNGKLIETGFGSQGDGDPLTVLVTDTNGIPLAGVAVDFNVTSGTGNVVNYYNADGTPGTTTDKNGMARSDFYAQTPASGNDFEVQTVVASTPYGSVSFYEIEYAYLIIGSTHPAFPPDVVPMGPGCPNPCNVTVPEGGVAQNALSALILAASIPQLNCPTSSSSVCPIPDVGLRIVSDASALTPSPYASCNASSTLSDANTGIASCNVQSVCNATGPGIYQAYLEVGDYKGYPLTVTITPGSPTQLAILSGNNQSGPAGQTLQFPLVATVTDACGKVVTAGQVTWKITQGSATLTNVVSNSGSSGQVSANVLFGSAPGPVTVTATLGTASVLTFSLTAQPVISSMTILNGNNQTGTINAAFPQTLTVQIKDANNNPVPSVSVTFNVTTQNASANPTSVATDSLGRASTTVTAGASPGPITVIASYGPVSAAFSLTSVPQGPVVTASSFQNAASFLNGLVPCGLATATGSGVATGIVGTVSGASFFGPLQYTLNGLSMSVNGVPAPIYQLSNTNGKQQVTFQTPCEVAPTPNGTVVISVSGASTTIQGVLILQAQPGIFYATDANGNQFGDVISADDGTYVTAANPAKRGHNYYVIVTGLNQVTPATATNSVGINGQNVVLPVVVGLDNLGVPVFAQIYQQGAVGVYAIGFTIPPTNPAGPLQPLVVGVVVNGQTIFSNTVTVAAVQ